VLFQVVELRFDFIYVLTIIIYSASTFYILLLPFLSRKISGDDIREFIKSQYTADRIVVTAVGGAYLYKEWTLLANFSR
jgi:hypothetical protein